MPGGANPFDVSDSAWDAICDATNKARKNHTAGRSANPPWAADEILLALDFYFQHGSQSPEDSRTIALSAVLRSLPLELSRPDAERFRSPNSLYMKFQNFKALDPDYPGAGLRAGSHLDEELFNRYRGHADKLHALALAIAAAAQRGLPPASLQEEDFAALEGTILVAIHRSLERSGALVAKKKKLGTRADGTISCDVCDFEFSARYGPDLRGFIECHHLLPLAGAPARTTRLRDLALVCANCHRMAHRVVPSRETITELRELLR
jgi:5-methylcytosine-specific restriction protein A